MAWEKVVLKIDNQDVHGMFNGKELNMPVCDIKDTIKVNGKIMKVMSSVIDTRDNIIKVKLAKASESKGEKSDGKSTKG
ncbi:MAG: hypothetical protein CMJ25_12935 [Phycisphaerae bacterium]|nr:hypothetical protein [Phycisphaerae bacterium]|tara:strand:- start:2366 stop:2602 length:237 start_codon:yes stop_codon:yes gene_type:complete